jgi:hypothetical protein
MPKAYPDFEAYSVAYQGKIQMPLCVEPELMRLMALRDISLQRNDVSLSGPKQTLTLGLPDGFMSSRPCHNAVI